MTSALHRSSHRVPFVESLESRQFLCATAVAADTANLAHANTAPIVAKAAKAAVANGQTVFGSSAVGVKLKFKKTKSLLGNGIAGGVYESGTFTDEKGTTGTYQLVLSPTKFSSVRPPQELNLSFKKGGLRRGYDLTFTPVSKRLNAGLNNKTVSFSTTSAGASAKGTILSTFLPTVYLKY